MNNRGVMTLDELNNAIERAEKQNTIEFRDKTKAIKALNLCLVKGHSNSYAMEKTGIHRMKIAACKKIVLESWREMLAEKRTALSERP